MGQCFGWSIIRWRFSSRHWCCLSFRRELASWAETRGHTLTSNDRAEFDLVRNAMFTLLGLMVGFAISMAVSRYDLRKSYEEAEANAIGTEYLRLDLMPPVTTARRARF